MSKYIMFRDFIILICVVIGASFFSKALFSYFEKENAKELAIQQIIDAQNRQFQQLTENIVRSNTEIVSKLDRSEIDLKIIELIDKNKEKLDSMGVIQSKWNENISRKLNTLSDNTYKENTGDKNEQYFKKIYLTTEKDGKKEDVPIAWAIYYPNTKNWKTGVYPIEYFTKVIRAEQKTGQHNNYIEAWLENNKDKESKGKKYPISITKSVFQELKIKENSFSFWNPKLDLNGFYNIDNFGSSLGISFMSYGKTKDDMNWRFLKLGGGFSYDDDEIYGIFEPISYNLGKNLPLISNFWISGGISINKNCKINPEASFSLVF